MGKTNYICAGCSVREGHEHRCTRDESDGVSVNLKNKMCSCEECADLQAFTNLNSDQQAEMIDKGYKKVADYLHDKFAQIP